MMINKESILYQTHQAWKYRVKVVLNGFGFFFISLIILLQINIVRFTYLSDVELSVIGLGFLIAGEIFAFSIRCPKCKIRWWWYLLKSPITSVKYRDLRTQKECPLCGLSGNSIT